MPFLFCTGSEAAEGIEETRRIILSPASFLVNWSLLVEASAQVPEVVKKEETVFAVKLLHTKAQQSRSQGFMVLRNASPNLHSDQTFLKDHRMSVCHHSFCA